MLLQALSDCLLSGNTKPPLDLLMRYRQPLHRVIKSNWDRCADADLMVLFCEVLDVPEKILLDATLEATRLYVEHALRGVDPQDPFDLAVALTKSTLPMSATDALLVAKDVSAWSHRHDGWCQRSMAHIVSHLVLRAHDGSTRCLSLLWGLLVDFEKLRATQENTTENRLPSMLRKHVPWTVIEDRVRSLGWI